MKPRAPFGSRAAVWLLAFAAIGPACARAPTTPTTLVPPDTFDDGAHFGASVVEIGDLDGDGVADLAVGASLDRDDPGLGSVMLLWMRDDGTIKTSRKLRDPSPFEGKARLFGIALAPLGDLDGNGTPDLAVGSRGDLRVLLLEADGRIRAAHTFAPPRARGSFGTSLTALGDLDGDGIVDLASGAPLEDEHSGEVWLLFLAADGTVSRHRHIPPPAGDVTGGAVIGDRFGESVAGLGDLDGDGFMDLAVGARHDDDGGPDTGAVWDASMTVKGPSRSTPGV